MTAQVPVVLLTVQTLADCAQALTARKHNRTPGTPNGAVLYDFCQDNRITKLAPPRILNRVRRPDNELGETELPLLAHRWMVLVFINNTESALSIHMVGQASTRNMDNLYNWIREPTFRNRQECEVHGIRGTIQRLVYRPEAFGNWGNPSEILAYRLCCALNDYLPEPVLI